MVLHFDLFDLESFRFGSQKLQQTPLPLLLVAQSSGRSIQQGNLKSGFFVQFGLFLMKCWIDLS